MKSKKINRLRTKGFGPFKKEWYSICSSHFIYDEHCIRCTRGEWINVWRHFFGSKVYKYFPDFWRWWVNKYWARKQKAKK